MPAINSFRELNVYQLALAEAHRVFELTRGFPKEERYSLTDQIGRSSRAVGAMVAEAWGRRRYPAAFANKIDEALAEAMETQAWLDHALRCGYIDVIGHRERDIAWQAVGSMLNKMIQKTAQFCGTGSKSP